MWLFITFKGEQALSRFSPGSPQALSKLSPGSPQILRQALPSFSPGSLQVLQMFSPRLSSGSLQVLHRLSSRLSSGSPTPARTLSIIGLKSRVLKLPFFNLKMMIRNGLDFFLKSTEPLQRYLLSCQANSAHLGRYFCTGQQQLWRGSVNFKIKNSRHIRDLWFISKMLISRLAILVHL